MTVTLRQPETGRIKVLQEGWSWGCFLGCGILGLPLYRRGLQVWGSAMVAFMTSCIGRVILNFTLQPPFRRIERIAASERADEDFAK